MPEYLTLGEAIKEFPQLCFFPPGKCAKCGAAANGNISITRHHIFPNRHWPNNRHELPLCMFGGKKNGNGQRSCHDLIEREIKRAEQGRCLAPKEYSRLTENFLREEPEIKAYQQQGQSTGLKPPLIRRPLNGFYHRGNI